MFSKIFSGVFFFFNRMFFILFEKFVKVDLLHYLDTIYFRLNDIS